MTSTVVGRVGTVALLVAGGLALVAAPTTGQLPDAPQATDVLGATDTLAIVYSGPLPPRARAHVDHLRLSFPETPGGVGIIDAGMADARIALQHVELAGRDSTSLSEMTRHMSHVLHAIDPTQAAGGPGSGYGFKRAAESALRHAEMALETEDLPGAMLHHGPFILRAARGASARADEAVRIARRVQQATSARAAHRALVELRQAVIGMAYGDDRDGDRRIGYDEAEMGLAQARYHLELVSRLTN